MKKAFRLICEEDQDKITLKSLQKVAKELGENMSIEELQEMIEKLIEMVMVKLEKKIF